MLTSITSALRFRRDPVAAARAIGVQVGTRCRFIDVSRRTFGSEPYLISIGNHVTITEGVRFITHDGGVWVLREKYPNLDLIGSVVIEDNVFIGMNALILPDVRIGHDSVVAAGAVVTKSVPPGSVVGGIPAKPIRSVADYEQMALQEGVHARQLPAGPKKDAFIKHLAQAGRLLPKQRDS